MKQRWIAALLCLCLCMSMLSPAAAAQGPGGLSTGDDSGATLTTGDDSGSAPTTGDEGGAARILLNAPSARITPDDRWDSLDLEGSIYFPYTGEPIEPTIFSIMGLTKDNDYTVSYKTASGTALSGAPADVGEYYVVLTGIWAIYIRKTSKRIR